MSLTHNDIDQLCDMARTAQGPRLNDIRCALNELVQAEQAAWCQSDAMTDTTKNTTPNSAPPTTANNTFPQNTPHITVPTDTGFTTC